MKKDKITLLIYGVLPPDATILVARSPTAFHYGKILKRDIYFMGRVSDVRAGVFQYLGRLRSDVSSRGKEEIEVRVSREKYYIVRLRAAGYLPQECFTTQPPESTIASVTFTMMKNGVLECKRSKATRTRRTSTRT